MSVEQTSQLIQLILNTVLMTTACGIVLVGLLMRHTAVHLRLKQSHQEYAELVSGATVFRGERLTQLRAQQLWLRYRCRASYNSLFVTSTSLSLLLLSTLLLSLRMLLPWQWLISLSLMPFVVGVGALLLGVGLALVEFYRSQRSLQDELQAILLMSNHSGDRLTREANFLPGVQLSPPPQRESPIAAALRRRSRKRSLPGKSRINTG